MCNKKWDWFRAGKNPVWNLIITLVNPEHKDNKEQKAVNAVRWLLCNYWLRNPYIEITMWRWCVVQRSSVRKDACGNASRQTEYRGVTPTKGALRDTKQWVCSTLDADKVKQGMNPAISWHRDGTENGTGIRYGSPIVPDLQSEAWWERDICRSNAEQAPGLRCVGWLKKR